MRPPLVNPGSRSAMRLALLLVSPSPAIAATLTVTDLGDSGAPGALFPTKEGTPLGTTHVLPSTHTISGRARFLLTRSPKLIICGGARKGPWVP